MEGNILELKGHTRNNHGSKSEQCRTHCMGVQEMSSLTPEQKEELQALVVESVKQTLIQLGISSHDPLEMQKDMQHLREWRKSMENVKKKGFMAAITIAVSGMCAMLWIGFKELVAK